MVDNRILSPSLSKNLQIKGDGAELGASVLGAPVLGLVTFGVVVLMLDTNFSAKHFSSLQWHSMPELSAKLKH